MKSLWYFFATCLLLLPIVTSEPCTPHDSDLLPFVMRPQSCVEAADYEIDIHCIALRDQNPNATHPVLLGRHQWALDDHEDCWGFFQCVKFCSEMIHRCSFDCGCDEYDRRKLFLEFSEVCYISAYPDECTIKSAYECDDITKPTPIPTTKPTSTTTPMTTSTTPQRTTNLEFCEKFFKKYVCTSFSSFLFLSQ